MSSLHNFLAGLDLRKIRHMLALAEHGSFSRAAEAVHITQPALSRSVNSLEDALGAQLFDRTSRQIRLTPVGHLTIEAARHIIDSAAEFYQLAANANEEEIGELRIGLGVVSASLFGPPLMRAFAERYPKLRLVLQVGVPERMYDMLLADQLDIVIGNTEATSDLQDMQIETVGSFSRGFFASANHPLARQRAITPGDLLCHTLGTTYPLPDAIWRAIQSTYGFGSIEATLRIRSNHYGALLQLMLESDAIVFGASIAYIHEVRAGKLVQLDVCPAFPIEMPLTIAAPRVRPISPTASLVGDVIRDIMMD